MSGYSEENGEYGKRGVHDFYGEKPLEELSLPEDAKPAKFDAGISEKLDKESENRGDKNLEAEEGKGVSERKQTEKEKHDRQ